VVLVWFAFVALILLLLATDLGLFHRKAHVVSAREGLAWSIVWTTLALTFGVFVYFAYDYKWLGLGLLPDPIEQSAAAPHGVPLDGRAAVIKYLSGYVVEQSLSVDNMFVMAMLFKSFAVPAVYQHRVLYWGILGALAMRGVMIAIGATLIGQYAWILYVFGAFLIFTAVKMMLIDTEHQEPHKNLIVRLTRRYFPVTRKHHGEHFIIRRRGHVLLTPLALALVMVESTDLMFAVDSIPAIFAITADPFLVFASNAFALLGLRSLYFVLASALRAFRYLKVSLAIVLGMVGTKMIAHDWLKEQLGDAFNLYVLGAIVAVLTGGALLSLLITVADEPARTSRGRA